MFWQGEAGLGRRGRAGFGMADLGMARQGRHGRVRRDWARLGSTGLG